MVCRILLANDKPLAAAVFARFIQSCCHCYLSFRRAGVDPVDQLLQLIVEHLAEMGSAT